MRILRIHKTILQTTRLLWLKASKVLELRDTFFTFKHFYLYIYKKITYNEERLKRHECREIVQTFFEKLLDKGITTGLPVMLPGDIGYIQVAKFCRECSEKDPVLGEYINYNEEDLPFDSSSLYTLRIGRIPTLQLRYKIEYPLSIEATGSAVAKIKKHIKENPSVANSYYS